MNEWNDTWREDIDEAMLERLAECKSTSMDVVEMATAIHKKNPTKTAADCFEYIVEWVTGDQISNGNYKVANKISNNYEWYLSRVA